MIVLVLVQFDTPALIYAKSGNYTYHFTMVKKADNILVLS